MNTSKTKSNTAVYRARALYTAFDDGLMLDDKQLCFEQNYYKKEGEDDGEFAEPEIGNSNALAVIENYRVSMLKNPVQQQAGIYYELPENQTAEMKVVDILGRVVYRQALNANQNNFSFSTENWQNGSYTLRFQAGNSFGKNIAFVKVQ